MKPDMHFAFEGNAGDAHGRDTPLTRWLLAVPQLRAGPHAGAVAGLLEDGVSASYVYPEIAGYYLRWLAFRSHVEGDGLRTAAPAAATQRWLGQWCRLPVPLTRVHFAGDVEDWRNGALFCFDLAMVLRGLGSAAAAGLIAPDPSVVRDITALLARCIGDDGAFDAVVPLAGRRVLPDRWSTRRGAFLTKAATGVLRAATQLHVDARVVRAAEHTYAQGIAALETAPHPEVHPLLYACEGILDLPEHARFAGTLPLVAARHAEVLAWVTDDGHLPESLAEGGPQPQPARVDVIAQALRVTSLLGLHGIAPGDAASSERLRSALQRHVRDDGGVSFSRESPPRQRNTWAAMFADQALAYATPTASDAAAWRRDPLLV